MRSLEASASPPDGGGLFGRRLGLGRAVGAAAAREELDALGEDVDARGVAAVLGLELVKEQAAVDRDLAPIPLRL